MTGELDQYTRTGQRQQHPHRRSQQSRHFHTNCIEIRRARRCCAAEATSCSTNNYIALSLHHGRAVAVPAPSAASADRDGAKKYSPPRVVTQRLSVT
jgi:hypothetical protein